MKTKYCVIFVTCALAKEAELIAGYLLKKRLAACATIINNVRSAFWWSGRIDRACETLVMLKTRAAHIKAIEKAVKKLHSYEVPEIIALPIMTGSKDYLQWIEESTV